MNRSSVSPWYFKKRIVACLGVAIFFVAALVYYLYSKNPVITSIDLNTHRIRTHQIQVKSVTSPEVKTKIYPFMAFLNSNQLNCGGTLIHTRFILTAAHCVYRVPSVHILLGTRNLLNEQPSKVVLDSDKFIIHENYTEKGYDNDIALIQLDGDLETNNFINIVSLSSSYQVDDMQNNLFVLGWGWGIDGNTQGVNDELLVKEVTAVDSNQCNIFYQTEDFKYKKSKILCTVDERGPCQGDSGGPLISNNIQIGVLSAGMENCTANTPIRYMNVGYYTNWIQNKISDTQNLDDRFLVDDYLF